MKVTLFMMFVCAFQLVAANGKAQNALVKLSSNTVTVKTLFTEIEKQTDYLMSFPEKEIDQNATVTLKDKEGKVNEILEEVLEGTDLGYEYTNNYIVISKKVETTKAVQQNGRTVTGVVKDKNGEPIIGANVLIKGTTNGTITDFDGRFTLEVPANATLHISYVGYAEQDVAVGNQRTLNIVLAEDSEALEELVVVGYGTSKKSDLTGSVASVSAKELEGLPASSANNVLVGRAAGVTVSSASGNPSGTAKIRIRGANSIQGGNDPLIVVDGNYADMPHTDDIASIEILKDASATAIYGSRGANGVIIVTTKRGKVGKPTVKLNANVSIDNVGRYDVMNAYDFATFNTEVDTYAFTSDEISAFKSNPAGTDWQDEVLRTAISQDYKLTISGGSENIQYYISPSITTRQGVIKNSQADKYKIDAKLDIKLHDKVSMKVELYGGRHKTLNDNFGNDKSATSNHLLAALLWAPTEPVYNEDGTYTSQGVGTGVMRNPVVMISPERRGYTNYGTAVGVLKINLLKGLDLTMNGKVGFSNSGTRLFQTAEYTQTGDAYADQSSTEDLSWLVNAVLSYSKTFGESHNFSAMAGYEYASSESENFSAAANRLPMESMKWYKLDLAAPNVSAYSGYGNNALLSYFGRLNYNYKSRYYVTANFRVDGSSKFREGNRFGYFPSFSLAWRLSEEAFLKDQDIFQNIKLRGGWGQTGNQGISSYATYATLQQWNANYAYGTGIAQAGYRPMIAGNPDLKWETTTQTNIGLDLSFWNSRASLSLDWYKKKTTDLLGPVAVPAYAGGDKEYGSSSLVSNVGSVENSGLEVNLNLDLIETKDFSWNLNLNGAINKNKVLDLGGTKYLAGANYADRKLGSSPFALIPGEAIGTIYGLKYLGIWQENQAAEAAKYSQVPGDYRYEDLNGDGNYDDNDRQVLGKSTPDFTWGFNNQLTYKNLSLNVLFEGVHGRDILNWTRGVMVEPALTSTIVAQEAMNRWSPSNPDAEFGKVSGTSRLNMVSSQYMEDGSYVKLRNISLGYTIPRKVTKFADIQLSVSAQNLLTFTGYKGYDPEVSSAESGDNTDVNGGMDWFAYPNPKSFSFGLSITY